MGPLCFYSVLTYSVKSIPNINIEYGSMVVITSVGEIFLYITDEGQPIIKAL